MSAGAPHACLYRGFTVHARYTPFFRRFRFPLTQVFLDVDRIAETARTLALFSYNKPNLVSFYDRDHGDRSGTPLRAWAHARFVEHGVDIGDGAIRLLCFPRILGFVFNPISLFFGYDRDGALRGVIYEVNNTFGETHSYVAPIGDDASSAKQIAPKRLYVSPFFDVAGDYRFRLQPPQARFFLSVANWVQGQRTHFATLAGDRASLTDAALARLLLAQPLMTAQVVAGIHWHALFLWLRGAGYRSKPTAPAAPSTLAGPQRPSLLSRMV
jgi:hypothetical protein